MVRFSSHLRAEVPIRFAAARAPSLAPSRIGMGERSARSPSGIAVKIWFTRPHRQLQRPGDGKLGPHPRDMVEVQVEPLALALSME